MQSKRIFTGAIILMVLSLGIATLGKGIAQTRYNFAGKYTISGVNPDGSKYTQTAVVTDFGDGYKVLFDSGDTGVATDIGNTIAIGSQSKGLPSVTILKIVNANQLNGYWQDYNSAKEGQETWTAN